MCKQPERVDCDLNELKAIVTQEYLTDSDREKLNAALDTLAMLTQALESKNLTLARLRRMLFGASTEKLSQVCGNDESESKGESESSSEQTNTGQSDDKANGASSPVTAENPKRKGHGRLSADRYTGLERKRIDHASLKPGDDCPECEKEGGLYELLSKKLVRLRGQPIVGGLLFELMRLRCKGCGTVFVAEPPEAAGSEKYDVSVSAIIALTKYDAGTPFFRTGRLQQSMGIPLPPGNQWKQVAVRSKGPEAVHGELIRQAAQGEVIHNDDTGARVLALMKSKKSLTKPELAQTDANDEPLPVDKRTGVFTTGIVSTKDGRQIALYFTGRKHAGENLSDVLSQRAKELDPPIQMCDALSRNLPKDYATILANCLTHGRRNFVDVFDNFKAECRHVLEVLRDVYRNDEIARTQGMSGAERLAWHQAESAKLMSDLEKWLNVQLDEKKTEPNSGLGKAIKYMLKRWHALTQFLRVAGAPLDNNICERILKKAILHRKNALFFKTENGARVGDIYMSVIHTANLCGANPFEYLCAIMSNADSVRACPSQWMPWNYRPMLAAASN
jgi:transposase